MLDSRYDDALAFLITTCWQLSMVYDPERGLAFSTYSRRLLSCRIVDWYRLTFGDARYAPPVLLVSIDAQAELALDGGEHALDALRSLDDDLVVSWSDEREQEELLFREALGG